MTIELSYRYSDLDKTFCFGLVFNDHQNSENYIRWVWFYLGQELIKAPDNFRLHPYNYDSKVLKNYKYLNDAKRQAIVLAKAMKRKIDF